MKILLTTDVFPPYVSGVAFYTRDVASALLKKGIEVRILAPDYKTGNSPLEEKLFAAFSINLPFYPLMRVGFPARKIFSLTEKFNPDIIHAQTQGSIGWWSLKAAKRMKKPLIGTYHTYFLYQNNFEKAGLAFLYPSFDRWVWRYQRWFYNQFDGLISPSEHLIGYLKDQRLEVPITHIPNPVDLKKIKPGRVNKKKLGIKYKLGEKNILYVGRVAGEKNLDNLIRAFKLVRKSCPAAKLIVVGGGPAMALLKKMARQLMLREGIVFTGFIKREKLFDSGLFEAADFFATASESENQPISLLEAMAFGLPIVGVAAMGVSELVTNNGLLSPPGDIEKLAGNMSLLLKNESLRRKLGKNSRQNALDYDLDQVVDRLTDYYRGFLS
ncbi:MAG: glycosyltransferase [Candidatus Pacebacteria bacterium]|nr:glycosyltransferase [Candidatus Paceibacterota bacterium]